MLGMVGGSLSLIFFGGLAVTLSNMSASEFKKSYQSLAVDHPTLSLENTFGLLQDMTSLFAVVLFISLAFLAVALFLTAKGKYLTTATGLYFITGFILLIGTQFISSKNEKRSLNHADYQSEKSYFKRIQSRS
ncbi:hypothetical protein CU000_1265 [Enterococcus faecium]|nr:hypothetical protein [Enterococcus faecium]